MTDAPDSPTAPFSRREWRPPDEMMHLRPSNPQRLATRDQTRRFDEQSVDLPPTRSKGRHASGRSAKPRDLDRGTGPAPFSAPRDEWRSSALAVLGFSTLFAVSLICFAFGHTFDVGALSLAGVLGVLFFGVGATPLQLSDRPSMPVRLGIAGLVGLSVAISVAAIMALSPLWHPVIAGAIIATIAILAHCIACRRAISSLRSEGAPRSLDIRRWKIRLDVYLVCLVGGTALWLSAALYLGRIIPGVGGFLPQISPLWYVGLLMLLAAIVLARHKAEPYAISALVSLVMALTMTPALAYGMPRAESAAKHIDLVQQILQVHHLDRGVNIYEAYSGFFAAAAWVCDLAGLHSAVGLATYWPLVVGLIGLAELRFFFSRLMKPSFRISAGMTLVVLVNAIGADYFSPQSVGFVLALGIFGLALGGNDQTDFGEGPRLVLLLLASCALAVTHELSPYIVVGALVVLVLGRLVRPWYTPVICLVPTVTWALFNRSVLAGFVSFADLGNLSNFTPPKTISTPGLHRLPIVGYSSHALLLGLLVLVLLAIVGFVRTIRSLASWCFLICPGVGLCLITVNPYGNEGIYRAALFGIPWLAVLATSAVRSSPPRWIPSVFGLTTVLLLVTFLVSMFGLDNASVIRPQVLQALNVYQRQASSGSYILDLSYGDIPSSVTFPDNGHVVAWTKIVTKADVRPAGPDAADASALAAHYAQYVAKRSGTQSNELYALWSPAAAAYAVDYGLETLAQAQKWRSLIENSPDWRVVFSSGGVYLFRVVKIVPTDSARKLPSHR
jgi:hypothetical protein